MYKPFRPQPPKINYRINQQITAPELRVVDEEGNNIGVLARDEAIRLAGERGLDLVEIAAAASPPVAKIISFDKFRYQKEKELKKQKIMQKSAELKQIRIGAKEAQHDLGRKIKQLEEFFSKGHKVEIMLVLRGREKGNRDWAAQKFDEFLKSIPFEYKIVFGPKFGGKGMIVQIDKK